MRDDDDLSADALGEFPTDYYERQESPGDPLLIWHGDKPPEPPPSLVKGILPQRGIAFAAGQSGFAKTFGAADLAVSVMTGRDFAGREVCRAGGVLWLAAEGEDEIDARVRGIVLDKLGDDWRDRRLPFARQGGVVPPLTAPDALVNLLKLTSATSQGLRSRFSGAELALIVIDTLSAAANFNDENGASEAQKVMNVVRELSRQTRALALLIDHYGKVTETGIRGSSAKQAAADAVLAFLADKDNEGNVSNRRMAVAKLRGGKSGVVFPFALRVVQLDGLEGDTCVVDWQEPKEADEAAPKAQKAPWTRKARILRRAIDAVIADGQSLRPFGLDGPEVIGVERERVRAEFYASYSGDGDAKADTKRRMFNRLMDESQARGLIGAREIGEVAWIWFCHTEERAAA